MTDSNRSGPLAGVRVLDLTSIILGPFATQMMADLGADVIKVESPVGDTLRQVGPMRNPGMGAIYLHLNRNKRSVVLDLKTEEGREACLHLVRDVDVLLYNVRPQSMERMGLSYEAVSAVNPKIVYVGAYGFGNEGPYAGKPAYDDLIQGMTGVARLYERNSGHEPRYAPLTLADRTIGLQAAIACLAGVIHSRATGTGQSIEVPMFEGMAQMILGDHLGQRTFDENAPAGTMGYSRLLAEHRKPYQTQDGYVSALIYNDRHWQQFLAAIDRADLITDSIFSNHSRRAENIDEVYRFVDGTLRTRSTADWLALFDANDIPCAPLYAIEDLPADPHLKATGHLVRTEHPSEGEVHTTAPLGRYSATPLSVYRHAPTLGEHTEEVLDGLPMDSEKKQAILKAAKRSANRH